MHKRLLRHCVCEVLEGQEPEIAKENACGAGQLSSSTEVVDALAVSGLVMLTCRADYKMGQPTLEISHSPKIQIVGKTSNYYIKSKFFVFLEAL